jgi:hypothetical protein
VPEQFRLVVGDHSWGLFEFRCAPGQNPGTRQL